MMRRTALFEFDPDRRERVIVWSFRTGFALLAVLILVALLRG